jgi:hypothetical protein
MIEQMKQTPQILFQDSLKKAIELYGLGFDNKLDQLLGTGLKEKTFTYLYGKSVSGIINLLALNSVRYFGGRALFVDAGNSADPYLIRKEADLKRKDSIRTRKLLQSIELTRVFTCHQLANFVIEQVPAILSKNPQSGNPIRFVGVSGFDFVFSEEDSSSREIANLQYLIARKLRDISKDWESGVLFVAASSQQLCPHFLPNCDVAIEVHHDRRNEKDRATLIRHPSRRGSELEM